MSQHDRPPGALVVTLASLTVVSGFVDAVSFLGLGHVFTANMTGNVALIGFAAAGAPGFSVAASVCALGCFFAGAAAGGRFVHRVGSQRSLLLLVMVIEAGCTSVALVVAASVATIGTGWPRYSIIALLSVSMGIRNAAVHHVGVPEMTTTVLTTTLTEMASGLRLVGGTNAHGRLGATSVLSMLAGAVVGAALVLHAGAAWSLGVATGILAATTVFYLRETPLELGLAP
jgi:uncharacterized membrane protein YoaK (UPF0700 family)